MTDTRIVTTAAPAGVQAFGEKMMQGYTPEPQGGGDLLPCPFCGNEADLMYHGEESPADPYCESWSVKCCHCGAAPVCDYWDKAKAITAWNTRPRATRMAELEAAK